MFSNKNSIKISIFAFAFVCLSACEEKVSSEEKKLYEEVIAVHDDVMPKMGEINQLKQNIEAYNRILPAEGKNILLKDTLIGTALKLIDADESMLRWMSDFDYTTKKRNASEKMTYLKGQKDSVNKLSNKIYLAIGMGHRMLKNAPDSLRVLSK